jgi:hypothetical protein
LATGILIFYPLFSIHRNSSHVGWLAGLSDKILKVHQRMTSQDMLGSNWLVVLKNIFQKV